MTPQEIKETFKEMDGLKARRAEIDLDYQKIWQSKKIPEKRYNSIDIAIISLSILGILIIILLFD